MEAKVTAGLRLNGQNSASFRREDSILGGMGTPIPPKKFDPEAHS